MRIGVCIALSASLLSAFACSSTSENPASGGTGGTSTGGAAGSSTGGSAGVAAGGGSGGGACSCAPGVPAGWNPIVVTSDTSAACPVGTGSEIVASASFSDNGCSCACDALAGAACSVESGYWNMASCTGTSGTADLTTSSSCWQPTSPSVKFTPKVAAVGACTVKPTPSAPEPKGSRKLCPLSSQESCNTGGVCVPALPAGFSGACVVREQKGADSTCPAGYPEPLQLYTGFTDSRVCTKGSCACGTPNTSCAGAFQVEACDNNLCGAATGCTTISDSSCKTQSGKGYKVINPGTPTGSCAATGIPDKTGTLAQDPTSLLKVCCTQALP